MEWLQQDLFVIAILAVVICFAFAIVMTEKGEKTDRKKVVEEGKKKKKKSGKSKKRVKFSDDVMVKNIDHFEVDEEPIIKDFELSHLKLAEKVELLDNLSEGDQKIGSESMVVKKESEVLLFSEESVKECDDVILLTEVVKGDVDEQREGSKDAGLLLEKKEVDGVHGEKTVLADCLKALDVGETDREAAMGLVKKGDIVTDQKVRISETRLSGGALIGETIESNIQSAEVSEDLVLDGQNAVEMARSGANEVQTVEEEALGKTNQLNIDDDDDDDDWEGVESSELEKVFAEAVNFVECGGRGKDDQMSNLRSDVQMQLYGLHRLALEGPCHEPQPMALKIFARAKWNAWQRLGSMSPEVAMEQYVKLLSDIDPGWMQDSSVEDGKEEFTGSKSSTGSPDTEKALIEVVQGDAGDERKLGMEQKTLIDGGPLSSVAKSTKEILG